MARLRVKVCGITSAADARGVAALGVDAVGLNFVADSPRCVTFDQARLIVRSLPSFVLRIGVFRDQPGVDVDRMAAAVGLDRVQLHGEEDAAYCAERSRPVIKVLRLAPGWDPRVADAWPGLTLLVDAWHADRAGGTGRLADWSAAAALVRAGRDVILAGGLGPENLVAAVAAVRPAMVDLNSAIESAPGVKDMNRLERALSVLAGVSFPGPVAPHNEEKS